MGWDEGGGGERGRVADSTTAGLHKRAQRMLAGETAWCNLESGGHLLSQGVPQKRASAGRIANAFPVPGPHCVWEWCAAGGNEVLRVAGARGDQTWFSMCSSRLPREELKSGPYIMVPTSADLWDRTHASLSHTALHLTLKLARRLGQVFRAAMSLQRSDQRRGNPPEDDFSQNCEHWTLPPDAPDAAAQRRPGSDEARPDGVQKFNGSSFF